jgi:Cu+-exporting ATPase
MESTVIHVDLEVEGMTCANCALGISRFLENKGLRDVYVNFATNEVRFAAPDKEIRLSDIVQGIEGLGYQVVQSDIHRKKGWGDLEKKLLFSAMFTLPLLLAMIPGLHFLMNPYVQLGLCLPVFLLGFYHFGKSGLGSLRSGVPNMDVLIFTGSTAAFAYSLTGTLMNLGHEYQFYETTASIITLVLLGNVVEKRSVRKTTTAIAELQKLQPETAKRLFYDLLSGGQTVQEVSVQDLRVKDLVQVNDGDRIPLDAVIVSGNLEVNESMITGESMPVAKQAGDLVTGGTIVAGGHAQLRIRSIQKDGLLHNIIQLVKDAQMKKPAVQKLADKIAAWFVPVVLMLAAIAFIANYYIFNISLTHSLLRSIAVLVIACPCAMGLATPTAVMVGLGRSVKHGILVKGAATMEELARTEWLVVDKTGTLTDGAFQIEAVEMHSDDPALVAGIISELEKHSNHPVAGVIRQHFSQLVTSFPELTDIREIKGVGVSGTADGKRWAIGNKLVVNQETKHHYDVYVGCDGNLVAGIRLSDSIKPGAKQAIEYFTSRGIRTILLSGDNEHKCAMVSKQLGIDEWHSGQTPDSKLRWVTAESKTRKLTMVGDGINDSPALAAAHTGISLSDASQAAINSAQVILLDGDLHKLMLAHQLSQMTLTTIKQNLFWAFFYNTLAIPVAAAGFLSPMIAALSMAFSDVMVIGNSLRLRTRKIK